MPAILNPRKIEQAQVHGTISRGDLPSLTAEQLEVGYILDRSRLLPGDLILSCALARSFGGEVNAIAQQPQYPEAKHRWTHAAIYGRYWRIIEATPSDDVAIGDLLPMVPTHKILVRRGVIFDDYSETEAELAGLSIAMEAAMLAGKGRYGKISAFFVGLSAFFGRRFGRGVVDEVDTGSLICSGLYEKCFRIATDASLLSNDMHHEGVPITPQLLSQISTLRDVDVGWLKIV